MILVFYFWQHFYALGSGTKTAEINVINAAMDAKRKDVQYISRCYDINININDATISPNEKNN